MENYVRMTRYIPRRGSERELVIMTSWHCLADKKPERSQRCRFAHIPDYDGFYASAGLYDGRHGFAEGNDKGGWISNPAHTYWIPEDSAHP